MNATERVMRRLKGEPVDRPPNFNIMMQFAAHYIGAPLSNYYLDYRILCAANYAVQQDFKLDLLQVISDPYRETADFGAEIEFPADDLPVSRVPLLQDPADMAKLPSPDPGTGRRMSDRLEAIRAMHERLGGEVPIMGWVEGALAQAANLRGVAHTMMDLIDRPAWLHELLGRCVDVEIAFARAQVRAGADIVGLGDAVASLISPSMYREFALPYEQRIFAAVHDEGALGRLHICGDTTRILADMPASGADIIDVDWMVQIEKAVSLFEGDVAVCGNFDPVAVMLQGTPADVISAVEYCAARGGPRWFCAAGCEIPDGTPGDNLVAQHHALRQLDAW